MSNIIGIEETIAKTMAEVGWPGADLVNEQESAPVVEDTAEPDNEDESEQDSVTASAENEEVATEASEETEATEEKEPKTAPYQPKWKKAALAVLDGLDAEQADLLRAEDKRREENFHKGIEQYRTGHAESKEWHELTSPYRATFEQFGLKAQDAVKNLLAADHTLRYGQPFQKIGTIIQAIQAYGINPADVINVLTHGQSAQQEPTDPNYQALNQRLAAFEQQQQARQREEQEAAIRAQKEQEVSLQTQIDTFAADPDHEHFELLRPMMAGLLQTGSAKDLTEAYQMAYRSHPATAKMYEAEQQKQWAEKRKTIADKAKKVTNIRSNGRAVNSQPIKGSSLEDTIRAEAIKLGLI